MADESDKAEAHRISRYGWYALTLVSAAQCMSLLDRQIPRVVTSQYPIDIDGRPPE